MRTGAVAGGLVVGGLVAVAVLSGAFLPGGDDPATGHGPSERTTVAPGAYPPGLTASGVEDVDRLLAAHRSLLLSRGYAVRIQRTFRTDGPAANFTTRRRIVATGDRGTLSVRRVRRGEPGERSVYELWANGSTAVARYDQPSRPPRVRPARVVDRTGDRYTGIPRVGPYLRNGEFDLVAVTSDGDRTLYTYRATGYGAAAGTDENGSTVAFTGHLVVTGRGRIRTLQVTLVRPEPGSGGPRRVLRTFAYQVLDLGVTADELSAPEWATGRSGTDRRPVDGSPANGQSRDRPPADGRPGAGRASEGPPGHRLTTNPQLRPVCPQP